MKNVGWICPRCDTVHAPSVLTCNCKKGETLNVPNVGPITIPPGYELADVVIMPTTCEHCSKTNGMVLTTHSPKIRCPITGELHSLDHICDVEKEKAEITGTAETSTDSTMAGSGGLVK